MVGLGQNQPPFEPLGAALTPPSVPLVTLKVFAQSLASHSNVPPHEFDRLICNVSHCCACRDEDVSMCMGG
jgi:hypothetical protein